MPSVGQKSHPGAPGPGFIVKNLPQANARFASNGQAATRHWLPFYASYPALKLMRQAGLQPPCRPNIVYKDSVVGPNDCQAVPIRVPRYGANNGIVRPYCNRAGDPRAVLKKSSGKYLQICSACGLSCAGRTSHSSNFKNLDTGFFQKCSLTRSRTKSRCRFS